MRLVILAAGQGTRLRPLTDDRPKCLVELAGRPLLAWQIDAARRSGIADIVVVGGYKVEQLRAFDVEVVENPDFATTNMVRTLFRARALFGDGFVMAYGDIVYAPHVLEAVIASTEFIAVATDDAWRSYWEQRFADPLSDAESLVRDSSGAIREIGRKTSEIGRIQSQYIGMVAFRGSGVASLASAYDAAQADDLNGRLPFSGRRSLDQLYVTDLLQGLIDRGDRVASVPILGGWVEVDSVSDLALAERLAEAGRLDGKGHG